MARSEERREEVRKVRKVRKVKKVRKVRKVRKVSRRFFLSLPFSRRKKTSGAGQEEQGYTINGGKMRTASSLFILRKHLWIFLYI